MLRGHVSDVVVLRTEAADRGDVDDGPALALGEQLLQLVLSAQGGALEVDGHQPVPVVLVELGGRSVVGGEGGVVDGRVEPAEHLDGPLHHGLHLTGIGDVDLDEHGGAARVGDLPGDGLPLLLVEVGDGPCLREPGTS